ncbi:MAG: hypothetical protein DMF49_02525 [Acidobacteria bacterium]|nr:MAG: hypothetical protein DMF49_02525 [Acidobacteriota bacterium]
MKESRFAGLPLGSATLLICLLLHAPLCRAEERIGKRVSPPLTQAPERIQIPSAGPSSRGEQAASLDNETFSSRRFNFEQFRARVEGHWFKRKALLKQNLTDLAREELKQIDELCREMGVEKITTLAAALVHEGEGFLGEGNFNKARESYSAALTFSPGLPQAHMGLAKVAWESGEGISSAVVHWITAVASSLREGWYGFRTLANGMLIGLVACGLLLVTFSGLLTIRYQRALRHDIEEAVVRRSGPGAARQIGWLALLLPTLTWLLAPFTPAYWLAIFFRYADWREKALSMTLLVLVLLAAPLGILTLSVCRLAGDPTAKVLVETAGRSYQPESILALEDLAAANPSDPAYPSLLGALYARGHFLQESLTQYLRAAELTPRDPRPHNNIGNLYFEVGRYAEACQAYRRAIELEPAFLEGYVNLYLAQQKMFDFRHAEEALEQGRKVNTEGIAALLQARQREGKDGEPIDTEVPPSEIWKRVLSRGSWRGSFMAMVGSGLTSASSLIGLGLIVLALLLPAALGTSTATLCIQCGRPFCKRCQAPSDTPDYCVQCRYLLVRRNGLHPSVRQEKVAEITKHARTTARLTRWVSLVLPGGGGVLAGKTLGGTLLLAAWCGLLGILLLHGKMLVPAVPLPFGMTLLAPAVAMAIAIWLAGNWLARAPR